MTTDELILDLRQAVVALGSKIVETQARCDALEISVRILAKRAGISEEKTDKILADALAACHQARLEQVESTSPSLASQFDTRKSLPELPDILL